MLKYLNLKFSLIPFTDEFSGLRAGPTRRGEAARRSWEPWRRLIAFVSLTLEAVDNCLTTEVV